MCHSTLGHQCPMQHIYIYIRSRKKMAALGYAYTLRKQTSLTCALTPMNVAGMNKRLYTETEQFLSDTIRDLLAETMTTAGEKERKLAVEKGDYHQGVPAITLQ